MKLVFGFFSRMGPPNSGFVFKGVGPSVFFVSVATESFFSGMSVRIGLGSKQLQECFRKEAERQAALRRKDAAAAEALRTGPNNADEQAEQAGLPMPNEYEVKRAGRIALNEETLAQLNLKPTHWTTSSTPLKSSNKENAADSSSGRQKRAAAAEPVPKSDRVLRSRNAPADGSGAGREDHRRKRSKMSVPLCDALAELGLTVTPDASNEPLMEAILRASGDIIGEPTTATVQEWRVRAIAAVVAGLKQGLPMLVHPDGSLCELHLKLKSMATMSKESGQDYNGCTAEERAERCKEYASLVLEVLQCPSQDGSLSTKRVERIADFVTAGLALSIRKQVVHLTCDSEGKVRKTMRIYNGHIPSKSGPDANVVRTQGFDFGATGVVVVISEDDRAIGKVLVPLHTSGGDFSVAETTPVKSVPSPSHGALNSVCNPATRQLSQKRVMPVAPVDPRPQKKTVKDQGVGTPKWMMSARSVPSSDATPEKEEQEKTVEFWTKAPTSTSQVQPWMHSNQTRTHPPPLPPSARTRTHPTGGLALPAGVGSCLLT